MKSFISHSKNYFFAHLATRSLAFLSIPILTRLLSPSDYGVVSIYMSYLTIFGVLFTLSTEVSIGRYYYEPEGNFKSFFSTNIILSVVLYLISGSIFFFYRTTLTDLLKIDHRLIILLVPAIGIALLNSVFTQVFTAMKESGKIAIATSLRTYLGFILAVPIIIFLPDNKFLGQPIAMIITGIIIGIYMFIKLKPYFNFTFDKKHLSYIFLYSIPLIPYTLSGTIMEQFGKVLLNSTNGASAAGLFSFAYTIGSLQILVASVTNQSWTPYYFEYMNTSNYSKLDRDIVRIWRFTLCTAIALSYFGFEIGYLLGAKNFHSSLSIVPIVVIGAVFNQGFYVYSRSFMFVNKTWYLSLTLILSCLINIGANMLLIPKYGLAGVACSTAISSFSTMCFAWLFNKLIMKVHFTSISLLLRPFLLFMVFYLLYFQLLSINNLYLLISLKVFFALLFVGLIFWSDRYFLMSEYSKLIKKVKL